MAKIYLLRHCDYDNPRNILPGRLPLELSPVGKEQATKLSAFFVDKNIARIYSSAVERCKQTAEIISNGKIPIQFDQRILETLSAYQGFWGENKTADGYQFFSHRQELGGEGLVDLQVRIWNFWQEITKNLTENILICTHGDPAQVLYSTILGLKLVDDNDAEETIPGWLEKGEFFEITWENNKLVSMSKPQSV